MPVGLKQPDELLPISGVNIGVAESNVRYKGRDDLVVMALCESASSAAVYTKNRYCAAPVIVCKEHAQLQSPQALLINAGNANAGTGELGMTNAKLSCQMVSEALGCDQLGVLPFSTGVIGEQLPMQAIKKGVDLAVSNMSEGNWLAAAKAIMTTDTVAKAISKQVELDGQTITITGITKGSGMICPNMATMLGYVATDAAIDSEVLQDMLERANEQSFNRITVDSDTSTNDSLVLVATGKAANQELRKGEVNYERFYQALESVLISLATSIVRDGEGATKFIKVSVNGGASTQDCEAIAYSVAHSPLVKTALYASDPNWGRILAAIGKAPVEQLIIEKVDININGLSLIESGEPAPNYTEEQGQEVFNQSDIEISIDLNLAQENYHVWTSDLSHDYVSINADYRS